MSKKLSVTFLLILVYTLKVLGDGGCFFHSMRLQMDTPYEYTSTHLRRQLIMFLAKNADYFIKQQHFINSIKGLYGWPEPSEDNVGPFSFQSYLQYMCPIEHLFADTDQF